MAPGLKPKLVYFQWDHRAAPNFGLLHMQLHVKCLAEQFDVAVINEGGDYQEICDRFEPDLVLFEAGVNCPGSRRPTISNTSGCRAVPKLGLHNGDPWCEARPGFLSDMDKWGVETWFTISTTMAEHTPDVADRLFVWPNFIDPDLFRDYGEAKNIPVLITGNVLPLYPWRQRVWDVLPKHYPALVCPHLGYSKRSTGRMMYGERYARTINASSCVPTCGSMANELLRKHLEIPASRSCLLTERSAVIEAAGFVDMVNCIFADADDVVDKVDYLFEHPDELEGITTAGYELVHSRHTLMQRSQILQWFELQRSLQPGHRIIQPGPFLPLSSATSNSGLESVHIHGGGLHIQALLRGDDKLRAGELDDAELLYRRCLNYIPWMPEPRLRLAICALYRGDAPAAREWLRRPIEYTLNSYAAADPDPVEWAYLLVSLLCTGDIAGAENHAVRFPKLHHPELDRARWAVRVLRGEPTDFVTDNAGTATRRRSVHMLSSSSFDDWVYGLSKMMVACGQQRLAAIVRSALRNQLSGLSARAMGAEDARAVGSGVRGGTSTTGRAPGIQSPPAQFSFRRHFARTAHTLRRIAAMTVELLNHVERRTGYFLPYRYSAIRTDEFALALGTLAKENEIKTAMVIGASAGYVGTETVLAFRGEARPTIYLLNAGTRGFRRLERDYADDPLIVFHLVESESLRPVAPGALNLAYEPGAIDLLLIDASGMRPAMALRDVNGPRFVVLEDINSPANFVMHQSMLEKPEYRLINQNLSLRNGYSVFRRAAAHELAAD